MMKIVREKLLILLIFLGLSCFGTTTSFSIKELPRAAKPVKLNGEWDFYWNNFVTYDQVVNQTIQPSVKLNVPSYWTQYSDKNGVSFTPHGYGTYVTKLILPQEYSGNIAFRIPSFDSSCKFFINDSLVFEAGKVGTDLNSEIPGYNVDLLIYSPNADTLTLLVHVSNFHHRRGGFWRSMSVGEPEEMVKSMKCEYTLENLTLGVLFAFGLFFLIFSMLNWRNAMFFFAFTFIFFFFRSISINNYTIQGLLPISWTWMVRVEYLANFLAIVSCFWGVYLLHKTKFIKIVNSIITVLLIPILITILFFPVRIFSYTVILFYVYLLLSLVVFAAQSIALLRARIFSLGYWIGILLIIFASINDTLYSVSSFYIFDFYLLKWAFFIFVVIQAIHLYKRFILTFNAERKLRRELASLNKNLEKIIEERTEEIRNQNILVEEQKSIIEQQNEGLKQDIKLKNRILSIIGHDLRSPLANIVHGFMFLNEENLKSKDARTVINKLSLSAESLVMLVENLLSWGLHQDKNLKYIIEKNQLKPVFKNVVNQVAPLFQEKKINVLFECSENIYGYFDEPSITIVLRNLVANAIKYTPTNGRVDLKAIQMDDAIKIEVRDNGVGIEQEKLDQILKGEEFESVRGTNNEKGTGLGLQLCIDLIHANNGKLSGESQVGKGSCFCFMIPTKLNQ